MSSIKLDELKPGESRIVNIDGKELALFNVEGRFFAIDNKCPHRGGPLARGRLEKVTGTAFGNCQVSDAVWAVRCPIHGWLFDLGTGRCLNQPQAKLCAYAVTFEEGDIHLSPRH